jgi:hypothetical protein
VRKKAARNQKRPRRADFEFPYLEPSVSLKTRVEETTDVASYAGKLNAEEKAWMNQFMKEYNDCSLKEGEAVFHTTAAERKICTDRNNARNRCQYTEAVAANRMNLVENDWEMERIIYSELDVDEVEED